MYSTENIKSNMYDFMQQKKLSVKDIEKSTGLSKHTIYSILSGSSKNPSAINLQLIAKVLNVEVKDILIDQHNAELDTLTLSQVKILAEAAQSVANLIIEKNLNYDFNNIINLIKEVYQYSIKIEPPHIDERFVHWLLDNKNPL